MSKYEEIRECEEELIQKVLKARGPHKEAWIRLLVENIRKNIEKVCLYQILLGISLLVNIIEFIFIIK